MARFLILFVLLSSSSLIKAQEIKYETRDRVGGNPVPVIVLNSAAKPITTEEKSSFTLKASDGDYFQLISEDHFIKSLSIDWSLVSSKETQIIYLQPLQLNLAEVEIVEKGIRFWDTLLVDDFELLNEKLLVLGDDYIVLSHLDGQVIKILINRFSFKRLEKDPRGNVFAFYEDSVVQIYEQEGKIYFYPAFAIEDYNTYIEPLAAAIGKSLILRSVRPVVYPLPISEFRPGNRGKALSHPPFHNKGIEYTLYSKGEVPRTFYRSIDSAAVEAAQLAFISYYQLASEMERFYDLYGFIDNIRRFELDIMRKQYQNYYAKFISFPLIKREASLWVYDHVRGVINEFDTVSFKLQATRTFPFPKKPQPNYILPDQSNEDLYLVDESRGSISIAGILDSSRLGVPIDLGLFATELKVIKGRVFYISDKNYLISKSLKE